MVNTVHQHLSVGSHVNQQYCGYMQYAYNIFYYLGNCEALLEITDLVHQMRSVFPPLVDRVCLPPL